MKNRIAFLSVFFLFCTPVFSQTSQGRILGTVTDPTGAVVPKAKITIVNTETGLSRTLETNDYGDYLAPSLPPGLYSVTVEATSFRKNKTPNIRLEVAKDARVDVKLLIPGDSPLIEVYSVPLIETTNNVLGGTFSNKAINDLPLNGRDFQNLVILRPGVQRVPGGGFLSISSNGNRPEDNNFIVDGTDNNDPYYGTTVINAEGVQGTPGTVLPIDAIQEFNAQENPPAEYGWKPGAIVNLGLKSGTNNLHGTIYDFERNNGFDARNWFDVKPNPQKVVRQHQFGASVGGPIKKNRTFFFGAYEGIRALVSNSNQLQTPATGPALGGPDPAISISDAIADLTIRGVALSPLSRNLIGTGAFTGNGAYPGLFPVNTTGTDTINVGFPNTNRMDNFIVKIDHKINDKHQLSGRYFMGDSLQTEQDTTVMRPEWLSASDLNAQVMGLNWVFTPNSRWVNEAKFGWNRFFQKITTADSNKMASAFGINTGVTSPENFGFPTVVIAGFNNLGGNRGWPLFTTPNETYQIADNVSYSLGKHTLRFGGEFRHGSTDNLRNRSGKGRVRFEGDGAFIGSTPLEDFLAGFPSRGDIFVGDSKRTVTINSWGAFLQDDWKIGKRLTLNFGVRYDFNGVIKEVKNRLGNFDPNIGLEQVGVNIKQPYNDDRNNFAPRFGFAWDVFGTGKTVVRGGGGIIYEIPILATFLGQNGVNNATTPGLNVIPTGVAGSNLFGKGGTIVAAATNATAINWTAAGPVFNVTADCNASPCSILAVDHKLRTPYVISYNLNVQQALSSSTSLQVAYVGSHGVKMYGIRDINQPVAGVYPFGVKFPWLGVINFLSNNYGATYNGLQATLTQRSYRGLSFVAGYTWSHAFDEASLHRAQQPQNSYRPDLERGNSDLDVRHRFTLSANYELPSKKGFGQLLEGWQMNSIITLQGGFPWNVVDGFANGNDISGTGEFSDRWNFFGDPSKFKAPRGQGIPYLSGAAAVANPDCAAHASAAQLSSFGCYVVGKNVLVPPDPGSFGNMRRNIFRGPGLYIFDYSLSKNWRLNERFGLQLRAEAFNVLNHPNLASPAAAILGNIDPSVPGSFGCSCATPDVGGANPVIGTGGARNIQFGIKIRY